MTWNDDFTAGYNWAVISLETHSEPTASNDHKIRAAFGAMLDYADSSKPGAELVRETIINAWFPEDE